MTRLTDFVLRHRWAVAAAWLLVALAGAATAGTTTSRLTADFALPGQPSYTADTRITALFHNGGAQQPIVLAVTAPAGTSPETASATANRLVTAAAARVVPGSRVADTADTGDPKLATGGGTTQVALVFTPAINSFSGINPAPRLTAVVSAAAPPGWSAGATGLAQLESGGAPKGTSTLTETLLGGVGALAVLGFVFASFIAVVPLLMALVAIPTTFLAVLGLTEVSSVSTVVQFLVALIGLGVAIDYSLLVVNRWREQRARGAANVDAVRSAMATAGRSVVFSGVTVAVSLLALVVLPVPFLANIGVAGFLIPIVSIAVAVTLLPVLLASVGPWMDRPRIRQEASASRPWSAWARLVLRHRKLAAASAVAVLLALLLPLGGIRLGEPLSSALAQSGPAHVTLDHLEASGIPSGVIAPIEVLVRAGDAPAVAARLGRVQGVYTALAFLGSHYARAGLSVVDVLPSAEPSAVAGAATVAAVRGAASGLAGVAGVGGAGPTQADFIHAVYGGFPLMLGLISLATLLLLTRAFRSLVLAAKAVVFNLASVAAAYGVLVLVWQEGHGSSAVWSVPATGSLTVWVPIMVFAFLFGLSMDYEVFILSRVREEYDLSGSTEQAVVAGIGRTGRLVTSAATILCLAFVSMSSAPVTDVKILATGLGAGILLDAFVVRSLLLPATIGLLAKWNWWVPTWMARALRITPGARPMTVAPAAAIPAAPASTAPTPVSQT